MRKLTTIAAVILLPLVAMAVVKYDHVVSGRTDTDNIRLDGNTVSTLNANGDLTVDLNGTGAVIFTDLTATTVPYLDASKKLTSSAVTPTELGYVSGVTSAVQTQLDAKIPKTLTTTTGDMIYASSANTPARLAIGTQYQVLQAGASTPSYGALNLAQAAAVTGTLPNANTTAASANTVSAIVARDGSGNFSAGTISAALTGNASTATALAANGADCSAGSFPLGVDASGAAASCTTTTSGNTQYTANQYGVVLSGAANTMVVLAPDASTSKVLTSGGSSANPSWQAVASAPTQSYELSNVGCALPTYAAGAMTVTLKQGDGATDCSTGSAACNIGFRGSTVTVGSYTQRQVTAALSMVVNSTATLGATSAVAQTLYLGAIDTGSGVVLGITGSYFDDGTVISSTAVTTAADAVNVIYSTDAQTSKPWRNLCRYKSTQTTAGTWAQNMTEVAVAPYDTHLAMSSPVRLHVTTANVSPVNGACAINTQSDNTFSVSASTATGDCTLAMQGFSAAPICSTTPAAAGGPTTQIDAHIYSVSSTSLRFIQSSMSSGSSTIAGDNNPVHIICIGAK